jgi:hypothetical protein
VKAKAVSWERKSNLKFVSMGSLLRGSIRFSFGFTVSGIKDKIWNWLTMLRRKEYCFAEVRSTLSTFFDISAIRYVKIRFVRYFDNLVDQSVRLVVHTSDRRPRYPSAPSIGLAVGH